MRISDWSSDVCSSDLSDIPLLEFVLGVMAFAYSGLLGVYITAVFSKRGSTASVIAAFAVGFVVVMLFQPFTIDVLGLPEALKKIAFPWHLCVGVTVSKLVCLIGKRTKEVINAGQTG